jgi:aminopeptidase-like protein
MTQVGAAPGVDTAVLLERWMHRLFPIARSITGNGNRETLRLLQEIVPVAIHEVPSGARVYDWVVPDEWNIAGAWIADRAGRRVIDFQRTNLHVVSYSEPMRGTLEWSALQPHLHVHPELPDAIPYRTSYYRRTWGFCVTAAQYRELEADGGPFDVCVDSMLEPGSLTYGELLIPGRSMQEILLSCYICHPSMANDSLSGVVLTAVLARELMARADRYYSYRVVFVPETIGAIAYCALNEAAMKRIDLGLVITTVGGPGPFEYKQSFDAGHGVNVAIEQAFRDLGVAFSAYPFDVHGSDERQYSSQGFRINVATVARDRYYHYPQYHSSLDDLTFVTGTQMAETLDVYRAVLDRLERRRIYRRVVPHCEVMLSRHDLYPKTGGAQRPGEDDRSDLDLTLWMLFLVDGRMAIDDIARRLSVEIGRLQPIADRLVERGVLAVV